MSATALLAGSARMPAESCQLAASRDHRRSRADSAHEGGLGAASVAPEDGRLLWKHPWPSDSRIMQPAVMADGDLLISAGDGMGGTGVRRIAVLHGPAGWTTEERWTSTGLKSNFNDFVIHDGHVFGFHGGTPACHDAKDGQRKWKGGRYGAGQLVLLRDQGLLLVLSEEGELALVTAASHRFTEVARFPAMEGKTWNHPLLIGDRLLVRNGAEMVAFRQSPSRASEISLGAKKRRQSGQRLYFPVGFAPAQGSAR